MAVFAGIWQRRGGRVRDGATADLLAALHAPFHSVFSAFDDDHLVLGAKSLAQPAIVSHGGVVVALGGRLDQDMDAAGVLDAYLDDGNGGLQAVAGDYALAVFDPRRHTLLLMRDAVGTQPLYYYADAERFVFGSQIKAVLAGSRVAPRPNRAALAQLLIGGEGLPPGSTCFENVSALPPGQALFVTADTLSGASHVELRPIVPTPLHTFEQCTAAFRRALLTSVERRVARAGNTAVLVSGGVDSAALVCAAAHTTPRERLLAISYGLRDGSAADERTHVNAVLQSSSVRGVYLDLEPLGFPDQVDADVWAGETPVIDEVPGTLRRAAAAARAHGAHHLLTGTWADQVLFPFPPPYLVELLRAGKVREFLRLERALPQWMSDVEPARIRRAIIGRTLRGVLPGGLLNRIRPVRHEAAEWFDTLAPMVIPARQPPLTHVAGLRREITGGASVDAMEGTTKWGWSHGLETQLPYLDADLVQLLLALPAHHTLHNGTPKALLREAMAGMVPDSVRWRRDKGDYTAPIETTFQGTRQESIDRLENGRRLVSHGFMSQAAADRNLARLRQAGDIDRGMLASLVGLDAWLRVYLEAAQRRPHETGIAVYAG